jgi:hypothetical protein
MSNGPEQSERFPFSGYVIINLIFWAYCLIQFLVVKWLIGDITGLIFFFVVLAVGFTLISIYDALYDRLSRPEKEEETAGQSRPSAT